MYVMTQLPETITLLTSLTEMSLGSGDFLSCSVYLLYWYKSTNTDAASRSCRSNVITVLPNGLHVLTNLERLNLRDNPITQLPLDFGEMSTHFCHFFLAQFTGTKVRILMLTRGAAGRRCASLRLTSTSSLSLRRRSRSTASL